MLFPSVLRQLYEWGGQNVNISLYVGKKGAGDEKVNISLYVVKKWHFPGVHFMVWGAQNVSLTAPFEKECFFLAFYENFTSWEAKM